jgi:hypothetical protein
VGVIEFVQNYSDLSTDQGYQFTFHCDKCGNGYMSSFQQNKLEMAGGFLRAAGGLLGGVLGRVGDSAFEVQRAIGGPQHDAALNAAVTEIKPLFTQCHRCGTWVCRQICWNAERSLCKQCAPIMAEELASAQATIARQQIVERAGQSDQTAGLDASIKSTAATCPHCGASEVAGKFCMECGGALNIKHTCAFCSAEIPSGAKFCPECGAKA